MAHPICKDTPNGPVPIEKSCVRYWLCIGGYPRLQRCPAGLAVNPSTLKCELASTVPGCEPPPNSNSANPAEEEEESEQPNNSSGSQPNDNNSNSNSNSNNNNRPTSSSNSKSTAISGSSNNNFNQFRSQQGVRLVG